MLTKFYSERESYNKWGTNVFVKVDVEVLVGVDPAQSVEPGRPGGSAENSMDDVFQNLIYKKWIHWKFDERCFFLKILFIKGFAACLMKDEWPWDLTTRYWSTQSPSVGDKSSVSTKSTRTSEKQPLIETKSCDAIFYPWTSDLSPDKPQARQRGVWSGKYRPHCRDWKKYHREEEASRHKHTWKKAQTIAQTQNWYQSTEIAHHNAWSLEPIFSSTVNRHSDLFICFAEVSQKTSTYKS